MRAVILAGGRGVRLRPYTTCLPKPLVPLGDEVTMIESLVRQLKAQGFSRVTLALGHLGQLIESFVGDGSQWGVTIDCWHEDEPLGTAGPLVRHRERLPEHVVVLNADLLCDLDMGGMLRRHIERGAAITVAGYRRSVRIEFGVLDVADGRLTGFEEKPSFGCLVNMGIYCVSRSLLDAMEPGPLGFDALLSRALTGGEPPHIHIFDGYWLDIGRPDDYDRANRDFPMLKQRLWQLEPEAAAGSGELGGLVGQPTARAAPAAASANGSGDAGS